MKSIFQWLVVIFIFLIPGGLGIGLIGSLIRNKLEKNQNESIFVYGSMLILAILYVNFLYSYFAK
jgi:hypothetical protein